MELMMLDDVDPATVITNAAAGVSARQPYRDPDDGERRAAEAGLAGLVVGDLTGAAEVLGALGFTITTDSDPVTGRGYAMAVSETGTERAWGLYLTDTSAPPRLCVAVPHPKSDLRCEQLALRLWRAVPGGVLVMATVHRRANGGTADHAHNTASVFQGFWTGVAGPRGIPQVQIHGFGDATASEQVAVSVATGAVHPAAERIAADIAATGLVTTRSWDGTADVDLRALTNIQGHAAATNDWIWVHIEHNRTVREDEALWHPAMDAVAAADVGLLSRDRPSSGGPGHEPQPAGTTGAAGTSRYVAREDHVHPSGTPVRTMTAGPGSGSAGSAITVDASGGSYFRVECRRDTTLHAPTGGRDGQQIIVEACAITHAIDLAVDAAILLCEGIATPVTIPRGRRWFGTLTNLGQEGWILTTASRQR
jgi:hypothetical protein